ncbi:MAG: trypsin-like peptidase domain-containing protein [Pyrinomonadaceae bacterium]
MSVCKKSYARKIRRGLTHLIFACLIFGAAASFSRAQTETDKIKAAAITPEMLSASFAEVSKRVEPAVVNIDTKGKMPADITLKSGDGEKPSADDIAEFYRRLAPRRPSYAIGSGFIVDKAGYILTNNHVIDDASRITVKLQSGEEYIATVVGADEQTDLAVLKIDAGHDLPFLKLGDSDAAQIGDWVLAIGSPFGLAQTVTAGIVSQTNRETPYSSQFQKFIQTDAAINRGNSGGTLVNLNGEVIGVNSQIATSTGDYNGIGFALPSNDTANVYRQIRESGKVRRGYLGVFLDSVKTEYAKIYNLSEAKGAIITGIRDRQGAAANGGLQTGDVVLEFGDAKILNAADFAAKIAATAPEKEVNITYLREVGDTMERKTSLVKIAERPSPNTAAVGEEGTARKLTVSDVKKPIEPFGLTLIEVTPQLSAVYKLEGEKGLIIRSINPASFIADVKNARGLDALNEGDLIQRINRVKITDIKSFNEIVSRLKKGDAVVLQVQSYDLETQHLQLRIIQFTVQ